MNSPDPWRDMQSAPPASIMTVPAAHYGHPFFGHGIPQGWAPASDPWSTRVFIGGEPQVDLVGARTRDPLTRLSRSATAVYQVLTRQILHGTAEHPYGLASDSTIRPDWLGWWKGSAVPFFTALRNATAGIRESQARGEAWDSRYIKGFVAHWGARLADLRKEAEALGIEFPLSARMGEDLGDKPRLVAEVAPALAQLNSITARAELDQHQHLHAEICVDGRCYKSCIDLGPAITAVMAKFAAYHTDLHKTMAPTAISGDTVLGAIDAEVTAAGDLLIAGLVAQHVDIISAGWLSSIGGAIGKTLRKLKGPITLVATGVATAYGGPAAGAAAAKFAPMLTDFQANLVDPKKDPKKTAATKRAVAQLNLEAKADPRVAQALLAAQKAVTKTAVAFHVKDTAKQAAEGNPAAQRDLAEVVQAAEKGDPDAKATADIISSTFATELTKRAMSSEWGAKLWEQVTGRGADVVSGYPWYRIF